MSYVSYNNSNSDNNNNDNNDNDNSNERPSNVCVLAPLGSFKNAISNPYYLLV